MQSYSKPSNSEIKGIFSKAKMGVYHSGGQVANFTKDSPVFESLLSEESPLSEAIFCLALQMFWTTIPRVVSIWCNFDGNCEPKYLEFQRFATYVVFERSKPKQIKGKFPEMSLNTYLLDSGTGKSTVFPIMMFISDVESGDW